jgi:hypothetical protein
MLIMAQDGCKIIETGGNLICVFHSDVNDERYNIKINVVPGESYVWLGVYSGFEKARNVMKMIWDAHRSGESFQMPQDEDVCDTREEGSS